MQRIELQTNIEEVCDYLKMANYPHPEWLEDKRYFQGCIISAIYEDDIKIGMTWIHPMKGNPTVFAGHVACCPGFKIDWRTLLPDVCFLAKYAGAERLMACFDQLDRADGLATILRRAGFYQVETYTYEVDLWANACFVPPNHQKRQRQSRFKSTLH